MSRGGNNPRPGRRKARAGCRAMVVVVGVSFVVAAGAAWSLSMATRPTPELGRVELMPGGEGAWKAGVALPSTASNMAYTLGSIPLCVAGSGPVVVDAVRPEAPTLGFRVTGFATRPSTGTFFGSEQTTLAGAGFPETAIVTSTCGEGLRPEELAVEVRKAAAGNAHGGRLLADWHSAKVHGTVPIPFYIVLCEGLDTTVAACQPW